MEQMEETFIMGMLGLGRWCVCVCVVGVCVCVCVCGVCVFDRSPGCHRLIGPCLPVVCGVAGRGVWLETKTQALTDGFKGRERFCPVS